MGVRLPVGSATSLGAPIMKPETIDLMKWLLIGAAAGYAPMACFIMYLLKQLLAAKNEQLQTVKVMAEVSRDATSAIEKVNEIMDKLVEMLS